MAWIPLPKRKNYKNNNAEAYKQRREIYNTRRWKRLRELKLAEQPLCEVCLANGKVKQADDVHHVKSFVGLVDKAERLALAFDYDNLQSICKACHGKEHASK